jgi:O-antigen ligase
MEDKDSPKAFFWNFKVVIYFLIFFSLRLLSFALTDHTLISAILVFCVILGFASIYFFDREMAFIILIGELLLGGSGTLLEFYGISLRTLLLITYIGLFSIEYISQSQKRRSLYIPHAISVSIGIFAIFVLISSLLGAKNGHAILHIYADIVPFLYFLLLVPAYIFFLEKRFTEEFICLLLVYLIGSAIFSIFTLALFSSHTFLIHGEYYSWFRDVLGGKITDMGTGFFRIVLPEHLLTVPLMLIISSLLMKDERHHRFWWIILISGFAILTANLSRTYILAYIIGFLFLGYRHYIHRWFSVAIKTLILSTAVFITVHIISSGGSSIGFEIFFGRLVGIISPTLEASAYTRYVLLDPILNSISSYPFFGIGIGSSITFTDPVSHLIVNTTEYDWGMLELIAEFGIIGMISLMIIIATTLLELLYKIKTASSHQDLYIGLSASLIAFIVMTITAPALFHVLGICFLVFVIVITMQPMSTHDRVVRSIYRIFHRLSDIKY